MAIYAIGDIHGQIDMLNHALHLIQKDGGEFARIVFVGDYTDRGPASRQVLDRLIEGQEKGLPWICLKGNHDRMFEWYCQTPTRDDQYLPHDLDWLNPRLGGLDTLASYGVPIDDRPRRFELHARALEKVPPEHLEFLSKLPLTHREEGLFFCHAGVRPGVPLAEQSEHDLLWIREEFHESTGNHGALIVHGHTPVDRATHYGNRLNIDSGAGFGKPLTAAVFEQELVFVLSDQGRTPLTP